MRRSRQEYRTLERQYRPGGGMPEAKEPQTRWQALVRRYHWTRAFTVPTTANRVWTLGTWPVSAYFLLGDNRIHQAYGMTVWRRAKLAWRLYRTTRLVWTGTSYKAHLAMACKLLEIPPDVEGVVVECGSFQGGTTANLSTICAIVGRDLHVYDSFEGLPPPTPGDKASNVWTTGTYAGSLDTVRRNITDHGAIEVCTFHQGWFADTLPHHDQPIVLAYVDVDFQASLHDCMLGLWPHLTEKGFLFVDEYVWTEYCALFWSERYWRTYFDTTRPGLIGSGSGVGVGQFYVGPFLERQRNHAATSVAFTRKDLSGYWDFYPEEADAAVGPLGS